ncbi:MAG: tRNA lysidine(34) synthetase TilS [Salibacteraceae bacterium]
MPKDLNLVIAKNTVLDKENRVLVGVSGGADSIVLAYVLHHNGYSIGIAHCNFGLRGTDADADEQFTKSFAKSLGVPFYSILFETKNYAETRKVSIQMAARDLRYFWFKKLCKEKGFDQIAVGTHLTDNIETFIFNAVKGTGLSGLRGIKSVNEKVVRPLLEVTKEDIYSFANANGLQWREDDSNQSIKYHRNKIRHKILPVMREINPNLEATFQRNFNNLKRVDAFVLNEIQRVWKDWLEQDNKGFKIKIENIKSHGFADVVLQYQLAPLGFNSVHVQNLLETIKGQPGGMVSSKDYHIYVDREYVFVQEKRHFNVSDDYRITEFLGEITHPIPLVFKDLLPQNVVFTSSTKDAFFDFDKLEFPLTLRKWQAGDKFAPFGMKGVKKVSDLLIDLKVPKHKKEDVWVVASGSNICWVVGFRSSDKFKVTAETNRVYKISAS